MKVKTLRLNNSNLVTSTHFKVENTLLLVDVCHSKMLLLKVPNDRPLPAYRAIFVRSLTLVSGSLLINFCTLVE